MQWTPALILVIPLIVAGLAARRPGPVKVVLAILVTVLLDFAVAFAFWLQADQRSQGDTIRLTFFVAVPAAFVNALTLLALVRGVTEAFGGRRRPDGPTRTRTRLPDWACP